ncbi:Hypothetical Protein FCC1311_069502 [Hondaea fermentalgiana]|uniref:Uncharacterized protein n=1 Tax=Hondaea fermentalgiana TaxID=2315210 RepID=A0A2R5GIL2_9STRA|nr:Hypothetical Protein FCC1311_069502 [Hondaea fermentalgiana]|eukprot:GBG30730.1 Hypothetical Protein FCC1311_069502 [Hondaea fermentalgiana]
MLGWRGWAINGVIDPYLNITLLTLRFKFTEAYLGIEDAETRLSAEVSLGDFIRGRVVKDGEALIQYYPGDLPFLLFCIHTNNGGWKPWMKNWPPGHRTCSSSPHCSSYEAWENVQVMSDSTMENNSWTQTNKLVNKGVNVELKLPVGDGSGPTCRAIFEYISNKTGSYPHMIYTKIPKMFIDFNRQPGAAWLKTRGTLKSKGLDVVNPEQWACYMDAMTFVREAKNVIYRKYGGGWEINFHTQGHSRMISAGVGNKNHLQNLFKNPDLVRSDLEKTSKKSSHFYTYNYDTKNITFESHFAPLTEEEAKLNGHTLDLETPNNRPDEDWYVGTWNSAIAEHNSHFFQEKNHMADMVEMWGETIIDICLEMYGVDLNLDYDRPYKSLTITYNNVKPATTCSDGVISTLKPKTGIMWTLSGCVAECQAVSSCKYVVMTTWGTSKTRTCALHSSC